MRRPGPSNVAVIVVAAGTGERLGAAFPKAFVPLAGRPMVTYSVQAAAASEGVRQIVVAAPPSYVDEALVALQGLVPTPLAVVTGGPTRQESVRRALQSAAVRAEAIVCHDAARPFAGPDLFRRVVEALGHADGAVPVVPCSDTVKRIDGGAVVGTILRSGIALAQTPQAFVSWRLRDAHLQAWRNRFAVTDDAMLLEAIGVRVAAVPGDPGNFKVTTPEDLERAERVAESWEPPEPWVPTEPEARPVRSAGAATGDDPWTRVWDRRDG